MQRVLHYHEYCAAVTDCPSCYCSGLIKDVIFALVTLGWQKIVEEEETSQSEDTDGKDVMKPFIVVAESPYDTFKSCLQENSVNHHDTSDMQILLSNSTDSL